MEIKFFRSYQDREITFDKETFKCFDYQYISKVKLNQKMKRESIKTFIRNINLIKKSTKEEYAPFCQKVIKLIYLRRDLIQNPTFNIPVFFDPMGAALTGEGRLLISTFYIPDIRFDCVFYLKSIKGFDTIERLIGEITNNNYLSGKNLNEKVALCSMEFLKTRNNIPIEYIKGLEFVDNSIYEQQIFDRNLGVYLSKYYLDYELWDYLYELITSHSIENIRDYVSLLDKITSIKI